MTKRRPEDLVTGWVISTVEASGSVDPTRVKVTGNTDSTGALQQRLKSPRGGPSFAEGTFANS